jgi:hypothetical protein
LVEGDCSDCVWAWAQIVLAARPDFELRHYPDYTPTGDGDFVLAGYEAGAGVPAAH